MVKKSFIVGEIVKVSLDFEHIDFFIIKEAELAFIEKITEKYIYVTWLNKLPISNGAYPHNMFENLEQTDNVTVIKQEILNWWFGLDDFIKEKYYKELRTDVPINMLSGFDIISIYINSFNKQL